MYCPNCGNEIDDDLVFCDICGTKLREMVSIDSREEEEDYFSEPDIAEKKYADVSDTVDIAGGDDDSSYVKDSSDVSEESDTDERDIADEPLDEREAAVKSGRKVVRSAQKSGGKASARSIALTVVVAIVLILLSVGVTYGIEYSRKSSNFEKYYNIGSNYYDNDNYKDARTQYINAARNAMSTQQKIQSYEMIYTVDEAIGGYDDEEIEYLRALIKLDNENITYYQNLIILYQNNDHESLIDSLVASAPSSIRSELEDFDGTIPVFSPEEGEYDEPVTVEIKSSSDVTIYYTTDGSSVSDSDTAQKYSSAIELTEEGTYTIRAYSIDSNGKSSKEVSVTYTLEFVTVDAPVVSLDSGTYTTKQKIEVSSSYDVYYTTDGTEPTTSSKQYTKTITIPLGTSIYSFVAVDENGLYSDVVTVIYDYEPEYTYSYNSAVSALSSALVADGTMENSDGSYSDGRVAYLTYGGIATIKKKTYYVIIFELYDDSGTQTGSKSYAVSCDDGSCYTLSGTEGNYSITSM